MKPYRFIVLALLGIFVPTARSGVPTADEILGNIERNVDGINDYTVTLDITVDIERLNVPPMHVTMYFKQPNRVHFSSNGFALLPKESIAFTSAKFRAGFDVEEMVERRDSAGLRYDLVLHPKKDKTRLRRLVLTVDPEHWTPVRLSSPQLDGRMMQAVFTYQQVEQRWLPASVDVSFAAPPSLPDEPALPGTPRQPISRNGSIAIRFSGYRLNTGLDDSLFTEPAEKQ